MLQSAYSCSGFELNSEPNVCAATVVLAARCTVASLCLAVRQAARLHQTAAECYSVFRPMARL